MTQPGDPAHGKQPPQATPPVETPPGEESTTQGVATPEPKPLRRAWGPVPVVVIIGLTVLVGAMLIAMACVLILR